MKKIKLFVFMNQLGGGGAERVTLNLLNHLPSGKYSKHLVILNSKKSPYMKYINSDVEIIDLNVKRLRYGFLKIRKLFKFERPDLVFTTLFDNNLMMGLIKLSFVFKRNRFKLITRESTSRKNRPQSGLKEILQFLSVKFVYQCASDNVIIMSREAKNYFVEKFKISSNKIKVIYNPLDLEKINQDKNDKVKDNKKFIITSLGRLHAVKNHQLLISAVYPLIDKYDFELRIIGSGPHKQYLEALINELSLNTFVKLNGHAENPYYLLNQSSLFVLSSNYEGFPNALLEAMAVGLPVISTNCHSGPSEIIKSDEFGLLVPTNNKEALTEAIKKLLDDDILREHYAKQSIKRAQDFKVENIIPQYEAVFDSLIDKT